MYICCFSGKNIKYLKGNTETGNINKELSTISWKDQTVNLKNAKTKEIYKMMVEKICSPPTSQRDIQTGAGQAKGSFIESNNHDRG